MLGDLWFKIRLARINLSIWLNPRFWRLLYAVAKQFKYDFGCSVISKEGIAWMTMFGKMDTWQGRSITRWCLDTGMQLSPIYLKEL